VSAEALPKEGKKCSLEVTLSSSPLPSPPPHVVTVNAPRNTPRRQKRCRLEGHSLCEQPQTRCWTQWTSERGAKEKRGSESLACE